MAEFVALATWLRGPLPAAEQPIVEEPAVLAIEPDVVQEPEPERPEDALLDEVCGRLRRFRAMLDDAFDYVQERGTPTTPLRVRVHPMHLAAASAIGLPLVADGELPDEEAVIELRCGSIEARLHVPIAQLLAVGDR